MEGVCPCTQTTEIGDENGEEEGKTVALDEDAESVKAGSRSMPRADDTAEVRGKWEGWVVAW